MKRITFARLATLLLVSVSLALSGCGGDDGVDQSLHDSVTAERDAAIMAQAALEAAKAEAETAQAALEAAKAEAEKAQAAAEAAKAEAETDEAAAIERAAAAEKAAADAVAAAEVAEKAAADAVAAAEAAEAALAAAMMETEDAMDAQMEAENKREELEEANTAARAARLATSMKAFIADEGVNNIASPANTPSETDKPNEVAADYGDEAMALGTKADISPGQRMAPTGDGAPGLAGVSLKHTADGIEATVAVQAGTQYSVEGYESQVNGPPAIEGWGDLTLLRRNDADNADQLMYIYTDIDSPETVSFIQKYEATSLNITSQSGDINNASSTRFPARTAVDLILMDMDEVAGSFDGVPGIFQCMDACTVSYTVATGELSLTTLTAYDGTTGSPSTNYLVFTPTSVSSPVTVRGGDDHLYFGYWLHRPDAPGGAHQFMTFAGGMEPFTVRGDDPRTAEVERDDPNVEAEAGTPDRDADAIGSDRLQDMISLVSRLTGTARFEGPAAGKYVTTDLVQAGQNAVIGQFTATAELLANFGPANEVTGVIRDFEAGGAALSNWRVTLGDATLANIGAEQGIQLANRNADGTLPVETERMFSFTGRTEAGHSVTRFTGGTTARIGGGSAEGTWVGQFYGNGRADGDPNAIVGVFDAHSGHTSVSGAFGAYNK